MKKVFMILFVVSCLGVSAATVYVNDNATGLNNGTSWADAYLSLESAMSAAVWGDQVWVAAGTYRPSYDHGMGDGSDPRLFHFRMKNGVAVYGGFSGTETAVGQRANFGLGGANETILSGDIGAPVYNGDNCYHVFCNYDLDRSALLDGFTIRDGIASLNSTPDFLGGGIYNEFASPTITNVTITGNFASFGGGMYNWFSSPLITDSRFIGNISSNQGGAINTYDSAPSIINVAFTDNSSSQLGGAIYQEFGTLSITNAVISGNSAYQGGGIYNYSTSATNLRNVLVKNNTATGYAGGGIFNYATETPNFVNVTLSGNSSNWEGGGMYSLSSSPNFYNCIIWGNTAGLDMGNQISQGDGTLFMHYSCYQNGANDMYLDGSDSYFNIDANSITSDPLFADPSNGDFRLYAESPAVNAGYNGFNAETSEIRGYARIQNSIIDMGAYEWTSGIDPANLIAPAGLTIVRGSSSTQLEWEAVLGAASYNIYRSEYPYSGFVLLNTSATNSYTDSETVSGNKYFYYVAAVSSK
jgi:predicted outer membrane repeat protein